MAKTLMAFFLFGVLVACADQTTNRPVSAVITNQSKAQPSTDISAKVIYGRDNRLDLYQINNPVHKALAASTAALVQNYKLSTQSNGDVNIATENFGDSYRLCADEPFREQGTAAFCSGFFVGKDIMVTAGHCIRSQADCSNTSFVFDYALHSQGQDPSRTKAAQVYRCTQVIETHIRDNGADYAVVRVDRPVNRTPLKVRRQGAVTTGEDLVVIGHPAGLPTKVADEAFVRFTHPGYFVASLDTYGGNSGSAVFNARSGEVEGILVRGEQDFRYSGGCRISYVCEQSGCRGEDVTRMDLVAEVLGKLGL